MKKNTDDAVEQVIEARGQTETYVINSVLEIQSQSYR